MCRVWPGKCSQLSSNVSSIWPVNVANEVMLSRYVLIFVEGSTEVYIELHRLVNVANDIEVHISMCEMSISKEDMANNGVVDAVFKWCRKMYREKMSQMEK